MGTENKSSVYKKEFYQGDSITVIIMPELPVYPPLKFKNKREIIRYNKLVYNVKKTLPIAKWLTRPSPRHTNIWKNYLLKKKKTLTSGSCRERHKKAIYPTNEEADLFTGKLLIKLVDRECNQSSFEIVKAFFRSFQSRILSGVC